jgi:hypothetical protein
LGSIVGGGRPEQRVNLVKFQGGICWKMVICETAKYLVVSSVAHCVLLRRVVVGRAGAALRVCPGFRGAAYLSVLPRIGGEKKHRRKRKRKRAGEAHKKKRIEDKRMGGREMVNHSCLI